MNDQIENQILDYVERHGPVLPVQVSKAINRDLMFAGAILSQLVSRKMVLLTNAKIGGSPVYYVKGQEAKLSVLYSALPHREKETYNLLKENKILLDRNQAPAIRVALRNLKDFAIPYKIDVEGKEELFWRWHTATDGEIKAKFGAKDEQVKIEPEVNVEAKIETKPEQPKVEEKKEEIKQKIEEKPIEKMEQTKIEIKQKRLDVKDEFLEQINSFLVSNSIEVMEEQIVKKKKEIDMVVKVPSNVGHLHYFVAARNKKNISDGDLSLAYHKGQERKLPVLFLSPGKLSKKAEGYVNNTLKGFLTFKQIKAGE